MRPSPPPSADTASSAALRSTLCGVAALLLLGGAMLHHSRLNAALLLAVQASAQGLGEHPVLWSCTTLLGLGWAGLVLVGWADRGGGRLTLAWLLALLLGGLLTHVPKLALAAARPVAVLPGPLLAVVGEPVRGGGSMPSGHALAAAALCTLLLLLWPRRRVQCCWPALLPAALLVAWSRVAVAAHWPADVLVGAGLGVATGLAAAMLSAQAWAGRVITWLGGRSGQGLLVGLQLAAAGAWALVHTGYPQGWPMQLALGGLALGLAIARWRRLVLPQGHPRPRWRRAVSGPT